MADYSSDSSNLGLNILSSVGANAPTNLYVVQFETLPSSTLSQDEKLLLMVNQKGFTPPLFSRGTYKKEYLTIERTFPNTKITGERKISFTFDVDVNYKVYDTLCRLAALMGTPSLGTAYNDESGMIGQITVYALDIPYGANTNIYNTESYLQPGSDLLNSNIQWIFKNCWINQSPKLNQYSAKGGQQQATVDFYFVDMIDPARISVLNNS